MSCGIGHLPPPNGSRTPWPPRGVVSRALTNPVKRHWPAYPMEAGGLCLFMIAASGFAIILFHPAAPGAVLGPLPRRALMGLAMGLTAISLIYSPWGQQSGAHFNPAVTLTFLRLGRGAPWDAAFYVGAQVVGGGAGLTVAVGAAGNLIGAAAVNYVATLPGPRGMSVAFLAELAIAFVMMTMVLTTTARRPRYAPFTGLLDGALVAVYITFEAPLSGMSLNPARSFASALLAQLWTGFWIYLTAPLLGMLLAAEVHQRSSAPAVRCGKPHSAKVGRCFLRCRFPRNPWWSAESRNGHPQGCPVRRRRRRAGPRASSPAPPGHAGPGTPGDAVGRRCRHLGREPRARD